MILVDSVAYTYKISICYIMFVGLYLHVLSCNSPNITNKLSA